jgi:hypothetical protein
LSQTCRRGLPLVVLIAIVFSTGYLATRAEAAEETHVFDAGLSLTGICKETPADPVEDPGCPGGAHPPGGRFVSPAIAVDNFGDMYVASFDPPTGEADAQGSKGRVDIFTSSGLFITEIPVPRVREVAVDTDGNLYTYSGASSEANLTELKVWEPSAYDPAHGAIAYANSPRTILSGTGGQLRFNAIALDRANNHLFVDLNSSVSEYGSAPEGNPLLTPSIAAGGLVESKHIAIDASHERLYASAGIDQGTGSVVQVYELAAPHRLIMTVNGATVPAERFFSAGGDVSVATEESTGHFFVADLPGKKPVYEYDEGGSFVSSIKPPGDFQYSFPSTIESDNGASSPNEGALYIPSGIGAEKSNTYAYVRRILSPPAIGSLAMRNVGPVEAEVTASVIPQSPSPDYIVEYEALGVFGGPIVAAQGQLPAGKEPFRISAALNGLSPGTSYNVRLTVENEFGADSEEVRFSTFEEVVPSSCPDEAARVGASAHLPDCRAYELVTPANTGGHPPLAFGNNFRARLGSQSVSEDGSSVAFFVVGGVIPGFEGGGNFNGDSYLSRYGPAGWTTEAIGLNGTQSANPSPGALSSDHAFETVFAQPPGPLALEGGETVYLRYPDGEFQLLGRGSLGIEPRAEVLLLSREGSHVIFSSSTSEGNPSRQLEPDAPPSGTKAIYDRPVSAEVTHVVSLLPGNVTPGVGENAFFLGASSDGSAVAFRIGGEREGDIYVRLDYAETVDAAPRTSTFEGLSTNGRYLFYLHEGNLKRFDTATGQTVPISSGDDATVANIPADGSGAYFLSPDVLSDEGSPLVNPRGQTPSPPANGSGFLGAEGTGTLTLGATEVSGVTISNGVIEPGMRISGPGVGEGGENEVVSVGTGTLTLGHAAAQSGSISFTAAGSKTVSGVAVSKGTFAVGRPIRGEGIPAGAKIASIDEAAHTLTLSFAEPLQRTSVVGFQSLTVLSSQNLYYWDGSASQFVATVTNHDVEGEKNGNGSVGYGLGLWAAQQQQGTFARDSSRVTEDGGIFVFESRADITGFDSAGHAEIYRYGVDDSSLTCISCSPSNEVPSGDAHLQTVFGSPTGVPIGELAQMRGMAPEGRRIFFQSEAPLVPSDTNGQIDVYEWEGAGTGTCARSGGCISLISSGHSSAPTYFFGASSSGNDAFILTSDLLTGADTDPTLSVYDARVDGGSVPSATGSCLAEGCRGQLTPPLGASSPASTATGSSGNVKSKPGCRKGVVKKKKHGKDKCVKKKKHPPRHRKPKYGHGKGGPK